MYAWPDSITFLALKVHGLVAEKKQSGLGEELFSTKNEGLGLGLFLTYTTLRRLGGEVRLLGRDGGGVLCRLTLPLAPMIVR